MPHRALNILAAVAGLLVLVGLALLGADLLRAASTGPRWRRRLVAAALMLLAAVGLPACDEPGGGRGGEDPKVLARMNLTETGPWRRFTATWAEADEVASGRRGSHPFDESGKARLLAAVAAAGEDVDLLVKAGQLSGAEGELLKAELDLLTEGVQAHRPTELRNATCYEPMMIVPAADSLERLSDRLPFLQWLADNEKLQPAVIDKVLKTVEADIATLGSAEQLARLEAARRAEAEKTRADAEGCVAKIKTRLVGAGK